ncbi:putative peptidoglycan binding protein [Anseongella ginsenosidimutans]|uniref:Putative peptidoglycan binding protein n=1 Tax=Anseongella ginsenosidimutans TaxID=496056 RepID=A0A4V2UTI2_9SPHI|nr:CHAP domain-containing protein [Anseongella ginsenosidimutans]QEC53855.1 CHAP domain-containing protein [Anseongella ginsenosidimutans]TCS86234.1 putative peptidoglycan binding protein [Anseongella ginsenosidimutans]
MELLKKGQEGEKIRELQEILRELDYDLPVTGIFDHTTYKAVRNFQSRHLDKHGEPLAVDGKVGPLTWWALQNPKTKVYEGVINYGIFPDSSFGGSAAGRSALQFAIDELNSGAGEEGGNNRGPWVKKYLAPTGLGEGYSWCAAFVSWCYLQAAGGSKEDMPFRYSAGARNIYNQLREKGWTLDKDELPQPGDIVCWWRVSLPSGLGHIGLVHHYKDGFLYTIEGNKAANVAGFSYVKTRMDKLLGYGRIP